MIALRHPAGTSGMTLHAESLRLRLTYEPSGASHDVYVEESVDLSVAVKVLGSEGGTTENGTVLVRLGVDGSGFVKLLVEVPTGENMEEASIAVATFSADNPSSPTAPLRREGLFCVAIVTTSTSLLRSRRGT